MPGLREALWLKVALLGCWIPLVAAFTYVLERHEATPGALGPEVGQWPARSKLVPSSIEPTLLLFAHPQCPCTRASLDELDRIAAIDHARMILVFLRPSAKPASWTRTDLWRHARRIPGAEVFEDKDGAECRLFGALTSGTVILYSPEGQEIFRGGITSERGHEGENASEEGIELYLKKGIPPPRLSPVFGCAIFSPPGA